MGQAQGPEAQVGGRVGDAAQAELDGVDGLVHEHIGEDKLGGRGVWAAVRGESGLRPAPTQKGTTPTSAFSWSPGHPAFSSSEPQPAVDASGESRSPVLVSSWRGVGGKQHQQAPAPDGATLPLADCAPPLWEPVRRRGG